VGSAIRYSIVVYVGLLLAGTLGAGHSDPLPAGPEEFAAWTAVQPAAPTPLTVAPAAAHPNRAPGERQGDRS
jgi:hypothetical protein